MQLLSLRLAVARIRKDLTFFLTMTVAVSLAFLSLFALDAISSSRESAIANYVLDAIPAGERTITASSSHLISDANEYKRASKFLQENSVGVIAGTFIPLVLLHQLADSHGVGFYLGSLNRISNQVRLLSGEFPKICTPSRCEVIQIGSTKNTPKPTSLGVVIVGKGILLNEKLFSGTYSLDSGVPLLLSDGIGSLNSLRNAPTLQGTNGWVGTLDRSVIGKASIETLVEKTVGLENRAALFSPNLSFTWPQDSLTEASDSALTLRAKINSIAHSIEILLFFFLIILAIRRRGNHQKFRSGLSRLGTPTAVLAKEVVFELCGPLFVGALSALALSPALVLILRVVEIEATVGQSLHHWLVYFLYLIGLLFLLPGVVLYGDISWGRRVWIPIGCAILAVGLFLRFTPDSAFNDWKVPLFGALSSTFLSFLAIYLFGLAMRRRNQTTFILLKEGAASWRAVVTVLSFAIFLASLSLAFSAGVNREIEFQASEQVPLDLRINIGASLKTPLDLGRVEDFSDISKNAGAVVTYPVLRTSASVRTNGAVSDSLQVLGVPTEAIKLINPNIAAKLSNSSKSSGFNPPVIKMGNARKLNVGLRNIPPEVDVMAWFVSPFGSHVSAKFRGTESIRTLTLGRDIPLGSSLIAFELQESSDYVSRRLHAQGEGDFQVPMLTGVGGIIKLSTELDNLSLDISDWKVSTFKYSFNGDSLYLHPRWLQSIPIVLADRETAHLAQNRILTLSGQAGKSFRAKVIATSASFPSAGERFIVMNLTDLQAQLAQESLGVIDPIELWVKAAKPQQYEESFKASKFHELSINGRQNLKEKLSSDPTITGMQNGYRVAVGFAGILALIFIISALPLARREKKSLLQYLEAVGQGPQQLRKALKNSLSGSASLGVFIGSSCGAIGASRFLSQSAPIGTLIIIAVFTIGLSEIGSRLYLRGCFREPKLSEARDAH